ncbi:MAG: hypothetical protein Q7R91_01600 [bacterium]|nr:hypothetical protein [bacterium]
MTSEEIVAQVRKNKEAANPKKCAPECPTADMTVFWTLSIGGVVGLILIAAIAAMERPAALLPLVLVFGVPMFMGLRKMYKFLTTGTSVMEGYLRRLFTGYGIFIAIALTGGSLIMLPALFSKLF